MTDLAISDHALIRFLERVKGLNLDPYREEIADLVRGHQGKPVPEWIERESLSFVVESLAAVPTVVTVLDPGQRPKKERRQSTRTVVHVPISPAVSP